jgi:hypothetical protein
MAQMSDEQKAHTFDAPDYKPPEKPVREFFLYGCRVTVVTLWAAAFVPIGIWLYGERSSAHQKGDRPALFRTDDFVQQQLQAQANEHEKMKIML